MHTNKLIYTITYMYAIFLMKINYYELRGLFQQFDDSWQQRLQRVDVLSHSLNAIYIYIYIQQI